MTTISDRVTVPATAKSLMELMLNDRVVVAAFRLRDTTGSGHGEIRVVATDLEGRHLTTLATVAGDLQHAVLGAVFTEAVTTARERYGDRVELIKDDDRTPITETIARYVGPDPRR